MRGWSAAGVRRCTVGQDNGHLLLATASVVDLRTLKGSLYERALACRRL
jgi:hypothetical protein